MRRVLTVVGAMVLVPALVIGGAHWQLSRLEGSDVRWSADVGAEAGVHVVGDAALAFSRRASTMTIIDTEDGSAVTVDAPAGSSGSYVGTDGSFAVVAESRLAYFSPAGDPVWERDTASYFAVVDAISDGTVTYRDCTDEKCFLIQVDSQGEESWRLEGRSPQQVRSDEVRQEQLSARPPEVQLVPEVPMLLADGYVQQIRGGRPAGPRLLVDEDAFYNVIALTDTVVGVSHQGTECRYSAARDGGPLWESTADCTDVASFDRVELVTSADRFFAAYPTESDGRLVVSIDPATGELSQFTLPLSFSTRGDNRNYALTSQAIISQDERQVTAYSPTTGEQMWERTIEGKGWSSNDADILPGVYVARGVMGVLANTPGWTVMAVGREVPLSTSTFFDLATGDEIGRVAAKFQHLVYAEGVEQLYLVADGQLMRIDTD